MVGELSQVYRFDVSLRMLKYDLLFREELQNIRKRFVAVSDAPSENHETDVEVSSGDSIYTL